MILIVLSFIGLSIACEAEFEHIFESISNRTEIPFRTLEEELQYFSYNFRKSQVSANKNEYYDVLFIKNNMLDAFGSPQEEGFFLKFKYGMNELIVRFTKIV